MPCTSPVSSAADVFLTQQPSGQKQCQWPWCDTDSSPHPSPRPAAASREQIRCSGFQILTVLHAIFHQAGWQMMRIKGSHASHRHCHILQTLCITMPLIHLRQTASSPFSWMFFFVINSFYWFLLKHYNAIYLTSQLLNPPSPNPTNLLSLPTQSALVVNTNTFYAIGRENKGKAKKKQKQKDENKNNK